MKAHLIEKTGHRIVVDVSPYPGQPRILRHADNLYSIHDPGFTYFGGTSVGEYVEYYGAKPRQV